MRTARDSAPTPSETRLSRPRLKVVMPSPEPRSAKSADPMNPMGKATRVSIKVTIRYTLSASDCKSSALTRVCFSLPDVQALRAMAVLMVVVSMQIYLPVGFVGVDVIS